MKLVYDQAESRSHLLQYSLNVVDLAYLPATGKLKLQQDDP